MRNRQISLRPSKELLQEVEAIGEEYQLSDADVLRQLVIVGLQNFKEGKFAITRAKNKWSSRVTSGKIREKIAGRVVNCGANEKPPAARNPLPKVQRGNSNE